MDSDSTIHNHFTPNYLGLSREEYIKLLHKTRVNRIMAMTNEEIIEEQQEAIAYRKSLVARDLVNEQVARVFEKENKLSELIIKMQGIDLSACIR